jgi:hypothetical protein
MTEKEIANEFSKIEKLDLIISKLENEFSKSVSNQITREHIFEALYLELQNFYDFEHPTELWSIEADFDKLKEVLSNFDFKTVLISIETPIDLIPKDYLVSFKTTIRTNNLIWRIHKNDLDPFPSKPHAHLISSNIKMDLTNGKCYRKKKYINTINRKQLVKIRDIAKNNFTLPPLKKD